MNDPMDKSSRHTDRAASALAKLKNKAVSCGRSYQLCLQLFCQEEFLRRLAHSRYADKLILKGGLFLYILTDYDSRVTKDIDFLLRRLPITQIREILEGIIATDVGNEFITFEIDKIVPISTAKKYAGGEVSITAKIKNTRTAIRLDFGVGDCIHPHAEKHRMTTQLTGYEAPEINTYSLESTVAEKLDAVMSLLVISSRMKDYHDLFYLANSFDFNGESLRCALRATFDKRGRAYDEDAFADLLDLAEEKSMHEKWNAYAKKADLNGLDFPSLMKVVGDFLAPPCRAACLDESLNAQWQAKTRQWL